MGRKIFGVDTSLLRDAQDPSPAPGSQAQAAQPSRQSSPALVGLREGLREMSANSIREIDPNLVDDDGPRDRLGLDESSIRQLAESIRTHGQQVPILVRPGATTGRYRVVYGRRRLAALKLIGIPAKAILRHLDDESAIMAQGQENSLRLDPSFIEKAVFVRDLRAEGYGTAIIEDALGIDATTVSRYGVIAETLPDHLIRAIGAAHGSGRRPWMRLAEIIRSGAIDINVVLQEALDTLDKDADSDDRLKAVLDEAEAAARRNDHGTVIDRGQDAEVVLRSGVRIGAIRRSRSALTISFNRKQDPQFVQWLAERAEGFALELHQRWLEEGAGDQSDKD